MIKTSISFLLVLGGLALFLFFANSPDSIIPKDPEDAQPIQLANAIAISPVTVSYSKTGEVASVVKAQRLEHYKSDKNSLEVFDYSVVFEPQLGFFEKPEPWLLHANGGVIDGLKNEIMLSGDVTIIQDLSEQGQTNLKTDELLVSMQNRNAQTQEKVNILSPYGQIEAQGMEVDFAGQTIKLLSKVKGKHDPI